MKTEDVKRFIYSWNVRCPVDRWWRKKHNVAFGTPEHRAITFIQQYIEYWEDRYYEEAKQKPEQKTWLKYRQPTEAELDKAFNELDLDKIDEILKDK